MPDFRLELVSPARLLFEGPVTSVVLPALEGEMTVMAGHAPVMTALKPGIVTVAESAGPKRRLYVRGGFADIAGGAVTILAEQATPVEDLNAEAIAQEMRDAEEDVRDAKTDDVRRRAEEKLAQLRDVMAAIRN